MRYKRYNIDLGDITKSNVLPDLSSIHNNLLEDNEYLRKETMLDGIVVYRARNPFSKLISMNLPEDHPAFNFDIGVSSCFKRHFQPSAISLRRRDIRDLLFRYIVHPLFNSLKK
jgi:hypothetical protein